MPTTTAQQRYVLFMHEDAMYWDRDGKKTKRMDLRYEHAHRYVMDLLCNPPFASKVIRYVPSLVRRKGFATFNQVLDQSLLDKLKESTAGIVAEIEIASEVKKDERRTRRRIKSHY